MNNINQKQVNFCLFSNKIKYDRKGTFISMCFV